MKIVFTAGGSGGHIFPILAIIREIKKNYSENDLALYYIGPQDEYSSHLLLKEGVKVKKILSGKLRRYFSLMNIPDLLIKVPIGIIQSFFWLFFLAPDLVFSKAGYGSIPTAYSAKLLGIPIFLHESDAVPGLSSRIESKWAREIFVSFFNQNIFPKNKIICVGNPIRKAILGGSKEKAKEIFKLQGDKPLILILGGSQGCQIINELILEILPEFLQNFELIHQTGRKNFKKVKIETEAILHKKEQKYYHVFPFLNESYLKEALTACDLIVSRAGAASIFEAAAAGKPMILVPLANSAQNHQLKNAYDFAKSGGGDVIEQKNLTPHFFLGKLKYLFSRQNILQNMAEKSRAFARPRAAEIIACYLIEYINTMKATPSSSSSLPFL